MTSYTTLEVQNFKGIREMKLDGLGMVNVFVGGNNVGKTSVLEALTFWENLPDFLKFIPNERKTNEVVTFEQMNRPPYTQAFLYNKIFGFDIGYNAGMFFYKENLTIKMKIDDEWLKIEDIGESNSGNRMVEASLYSSIDSTEIFHTSFDFIDKGKNEEFRRPAFRKYIPTSIDFYKLFARILFSNINKKKQSQQIYDNLNRIFKTEIQSFSYDDSLRLDVDLGSAYPHLMEVDAMGEGFIKFFALECALKTVESDVLIVDEIENGFHWSVQKDMWRRILTAAKDDGTQFFFTTHSYEVLESLNAVLQEMKDNGDDLKVAPKDAEGKPDTTQEPLDLACVFRLKKDDTDKVTAKKFVGEKLDLFVASKAEIR